MVTYYQSWVLDANGVRIPYKNGYNFLRSTQEWIKVTIKDKILFYTAPFTIHNREMARKAGSGDTMLLQMRI